MPISLCDQAHFEDLDKIIEWAKGRAGISRRIYPHLLRHAFGTHATMAGVKIDIQEVAGFKIS